MNINEAATQKAPPMPKNAGIHGISG
jgi:hypothetical protein